MPTEENKTEGCVHCTQSVSINSLKRDIQPSKELIRKRAISKFSNHRINLEAHMEIIYVLKGKV